MIQLRGLDQCPDLPTQRGCLGRVHRVDVCVLIKQLLQPRDIAVRLGTRHRRHKMINDRGMCPALGLSAFARIVDQERIDQRHEPIAASVPQDADMPRFLPGSHSRLPCLPT